MHDATHDAPHVSLARATLVHAARRLAAAIGPRGDVTGTEADVRALERSVVAYIATYGVARDRRDLAGMIATRVRSALWTDDFAGHPERAIGLVVEIARRAAGEVLPELPQ
jgi:hypothetical protein